MSSSVCKSVQKRKAAAKRAEIYLVVTSTEHELDIGVEVHKALDDLTLVDRDGSNLEVLLPDHDLDGTLVRDVVLEQVLALPALELAPLGVGGAVVPRDGRLLDLDVRAGRALREKRVVSSICVFI